MKGESRKSRYLKTCTKLTTLRLRSETSPRYLPATWANEYNAILEDLDALGFETAKFRILPSELQPFSSYTSVAPGNAKRPSVTSGQHLSRDLFRQRIESALLHVDAVGLRTE